MMMKIGITGRKDDEAAVAELFRLFLSATWWAAAINLQLALALLTVLDLGRLY